MMDLEHLVVTGVVTRDKNTEIVRASDGNQSVLLRRITKEYPSRRDLAQLKYGAEVAKSIESPCVLQVNDIVRRGDSRVVLLEDPGGNTLRSFLESGPLPIDRALRLAMKLASAIGELHRQRIVHKDIRPGNIFVIPETGDIKLAGFDIASRLDREMVMLTSPEGLEGNPVYMSPEQTGRMNRLLDYRTDFYSLGIVLSEMLTGRPPFEATDPLSLVHAHLAVAPRPAHEVNPAIPVPLSRVVARLLEKNAEDRYQSAFGLAQDLRACAAMHKAGTISDDFVPGQHDVSMVFRQAQKLYGRDEPRERLVTAFDRASEGVLEAVMVSGYSGIGKSVLVNELQRPVVERYGYFISGKYDQFQNAPYSAIIHAFQELVRQILTESHAVIAAWRGRLTDALGAMGQVVVEVIPDVERIIGRQAPIPTLGPTESQARFNLVFQQFVAALATEKRPVAVFLDDLQWADSGSLNLIKILLQGGIAEHLLLVGSYRDNEVGEEHPLQVLLGELRKTTEALTEVELVPLSMSDVTEMLSDLFSLEPDEALRRLTSLVYRKAEGNPFFTNQFLSFLHNQELIVFDNSAGKWTFALDAIEQVGVDADMANLLAQRIEAMPHEAQRVLQLAACIGSNFDLPTLATICEMSARETTKQLWTAMSLELVRPETATYRYIDLEVSQEGVAPSSELRFEFLHDRLQEAAYAQISHEERTSVHLLVGRLLLASIPEEQLETRCFDIVNQLNLAVALITDPEERLQLARLDLIAGKKAKSATAYGPARRYLELGVQLLPAEPWRHQYELTFELFRHRAEAEYLAGYHDFAWELLQGTLEQARSKVEKTDLLMLRSSLLTNLGRFSDSVAAALDALELYGVQVASRAELETAYRAEQRAIDALLAQRSIADCAELPATTDEDEQEIHRILSAVAVSGAYADPPYFRLLSAMLVHRSLEYGHALGSSCGYVTYAMLMDDCAKGYELARMSLSVSERFDDLERRSVVKFFFGAFVNGWRRPISESWTHLEQSYIGCLEAGSPTYATVSAYQPVWLRLLSGQELQWFRDLGRRRREVQARTNNPFVPWLIGMFERTAWLLSVGEIPQEHAVALDADIAEEKFTVWRANLYASCMNTAMVAYLLGDLDRAFEAEAKASPELAAIFGHIGGEPELRFYQVLLRAERYAVATTAEREQYRVIIDEAIRRMKVWAGYCPSNFEHKYFTMIAERARIDGNDQEASDYYDRAIDSAALHGFLYVQGMACELAGRFYLERGRERVARAYLRESRHAFSRWGADVKVAQLERRYPGLVRPANADGESGAGDHADIDLLAIIKASQAISSEIVLDDLLRNLMRVVLENAGAQRGFLVVTSDRPYHVEAVQGPDDEISIELRTSAIETRDDLAHAIIRQVERSRESVVLSDASRESRFLSDPYIARAAPRSLLCMPIVKLKKLVGILYLENNLVTSAFTSNLCTVLDQLAAQAAISIENARLYDTLEHLVDERTRELSIRNRELGEALQHLEVTQRQLITQEKLASLGALTSGIAHELKNPLNFVKNFAEYSVELTDSLNEILARQPSLDVETNQAMNDVADGLRENMDVIHRHSERANAIINGMLMHARDTSGERERVDVNRMVADSIHLACHGIRAESFDVEVTTDYSPDLEAVEMNAVEMQRVLINIINNALYAVRMKHQTEGPAYTPELVLKTKQDDERVELTVRDNGIGIREDVVAKIFDPFFTTKASGEGTGLGLSISRDIVVDGHQGDIRLETEFGQFTQFVITLPRHPPGG